MLPPRAARLGPAGWQPQKPVVRGAIHVHTTRSDGTGSVETVAEAAARAGLEFVIFTDHGDGRRIPDPPKYVAGVLCLDAIEISTTGGHYLALGLARTPYPLGGEARDVVEDVARLGGFGVVAHPESTKPELRWQQGDAPFDGLEWLNADSEWRDESRWRIARALLDYPFRPAEAVASILDRPDGALARWDALAGGRRVVGLAGADAHARIGWRETDPYTGGTLLRLPSYEASFRAFANRVVLDRPFTGEPRADAPQLLAALRAGRIFTQIDALAAPGAFEVEARSGSAAAQAGERLAIAGPATIHARAQAPAGSSIVLFRNGSVVDRERGPELIYAAGEAPGVFRVEVRIPGAPGNPPIPWIVANPVYVGGADAPVSDTRPAALVIFTHVVYDEGDAPGWRLEQSATSRGSLSVAATAAGRELMFEYALGAGSPSGQYVALLMPAGDALRASARLTFRARADRPMRASVQLRAPGTGDGERWQRSVYLDRSPREVTVWFDDMQPAGPASSPRAALDRVDSVLLVVDTTNTEPGTAGTIWLDDVRLER